MPIQTNKFHHFGLIASDLVLLNDANSGQQEDDTNRHVDTVETGERVEAGREQARGEAEALAVEGGEFVHLAGHEERAEQGRHHQPDLGVAVVRPVRRGDGEHHRE